MTASWIGKSTGFKRLWQFHLKHVPGTIATLPVVFALAAGLLLALVGQMQEIYLGIIERNEWIRFGLGYALLMCLSIALHSFYLAQTQDSVPRVFGNTTNVGPNPMLARIRHIVAALCGLAPQIGLLWGVWAVQDILQIVADGYYEATGGTAAGGALRIPFHDHETNDVMAVHDIIRHGYYYLLWCLIGVFVYIWRANATHRTAMRLVNERTRRRGAMFTGLTLLAVTLIVLPSLSPGNLVYVTQGLGPLAMTALLLTSIFVLLAGILICSRWTKVLLLLVATASLMTNAYTPLALPGAPPVPGEGGRNAAAATPRSLELAFEEFLASREKDIKLFGDKRFPIFIVSTQGGGIYAASAASTFLSTLQVRNRNFTRHLFAVSAVSGGSVGSAVFHAAISKGLHEVDAQHAAAKPLEHSKLFIAIRRTLAQDHLSPVLGLVAADYLEKVLPWLSIRRLMGTSDGPGRIDRASALEISLACAFNQQVDRIVGPAGTAPVARRPWPTWCDYANIKGGLREAFASHAPGGSAPSLVLNTTFAETGKRVAFANFRLKSAGEGSLHSFADPDFRRIDGNPNLPADTSLATAAVASARFPILMPAFVVAAASGDKGSAEVAKRWNFVDGGYADNSGVASAAAMFGALEKFLEKNPKYKIDLKLLILTDDNRERKPIDLDGTSLVDTLAPAGALLNVRSSISSREVKLAEERFKPKDGSVPWTVKTFRLDQENFSLQLGWNISNAKNYFVSLFTTTSERSLDELRAICGKLRPDDQPVLSEPAMPTEQRRQVKEDARTITQNRCNLQSVLDLMERR